MKEEYLWDKTGEDDEIERLESVLAMLRYQETAAPALPMSEIVPAREARPFWNFSFAFAFAAAAVVTLLVGAWLILARSNSVIRPEVAATTQPSVKDQPPTEPRVDKTDGVQVAKAQNATSRLRPNTFRLSARSTVNQRGTVAKNIQKNRTVTLTKEEKYAYGQLMLALSITSSKLKLVHDTIDQIEEGKSAGAPNDR